MLGEETNMTQETPTDKELKKPPISKEEGAFEILRVWSGESLPLQVSLKTTWEDPGVWGLLLVDIARHAAKAYSGESGNQ